MAEVRLVDAQADERDHARSEFFALSSERSPAPFDVGARELCRGSRGSRAEIRQGDPKRGEPLILFVRERARNQARLIEQAPEGITVSGEVMPDGAGSQARVDPDEQEPRPPNEHVLEARHAHNLSRSRIMATLR
jgi:hypothetical protein